VPVRLDASPKQAKAHVLVFSFRWCRPVNVRHILEGIPSRTKNGSASVAHCSTTLIEILLLAFPSLHPSSLAVLPFVSSVKHPDFLGLANSNKLASNELARLVCMTEPLTALIDYPAGSEYVVGAIKRAFQGSWPECQTFTSAKSCQDAPRIQWSDYDAIDWDLISKHPDTCIANAYVIRKALIRKHQLPFTCAQYTAKRPGSILKKALPLTLAFELCYPDDLEELLVDELYEVQQAFEDECSETWWILKPGLADKGQGIRLFKTREQLEAIFEEFNTSDSEDEEVVSNTRVSLQTMRHWVIQVMRPSSRNLADLKSRNTSRTRF
jgi:hypothetical protein